MKLDNKLIELGINCTDNIKSFSRKEDILKFLPIDRNEYKIYFKNNMLLFDFCGKISYIYLEKNYFSNLEIMKRIGFILGVKLEREDIFSITKFCLNIKNILVKGEC